MSPVLIKKSLRYRMIEVILAMQMHKYSELCD